LKGYDTIVGEKGVVRRTKTKSRNARTLIKDMPILIFDDSAVDAETDRVIRGELKKKSKGNTTFIISEFQQLWL
jgi:ATP-binding cassette subfamily B protein